MTLENNILNYFICGEDLNFETIALILATPIYRRNKFAVHSPQHLLRLIKY